jgi:hypothetical protein
LEEDQESYADNPPTFDYEYSLSSFDVEQLTFLAETLAAILKASCVLRIPLCGV